MHHGCCAFPFALAGRFLVQLLVCQSETQYQRRDPICSLDCFSYFLKILMFGLYYTVSQKNIHNVFDRNVKTNDQILIIFDKNIPDTTCHKMTIQFPTSPNVFSALPGESTTSEISRFYLMWYDCLINIMRKNTFCSHLWHCGWHFIQLSIFQLPAIKLLEVLAHYATKLHLIDTLLPDRQTL